MYCKVVIEGNFIEIEGHDLELSGLLMDISVQSNELLQNDLKMTWKWLWVTQMGHKAMLSSNSLIWAMSWENLFMPYANIKGTDQTVQMLYYSLPGYYNLSTCYSWNFKTLALLISWAG